MPLDYLHRHADYKDLIRTVAEEKGIAPDLVEKDYWIMPKNFMRHYYDVYCLLEDESVKSFIGTDAYHAHKLARFPEKDYQVPIAENEAFILSDASTRKLYQENYLATSALYYREQPSFDVLLERIGSVIGEL
jgi:hypothetical protein